MTKHLLYIFVILVLTVFLYLQNSNIKNKAKIINEYSLTNYLASKEIVKWKGKDSLNRAENTVLRVNFDNFKKTKNEQINNLVDQIEGLKSVKNIETTTLVSTVNAGAVNIRVKPEIRVNQPNSFSFHNTGQWHEFKGNYTNNNLQINYTVKDSLSFTTFWKRPSFLKPKRLNIQGISYNPNTEIIGLKNITVEQPKNYIQLSIGVSAYYDQGLTFVPAVHVGIPLLTL